MESETSESVCPHCRRTYGSELRFCPEDGAALVAHRMVEIESDDPLVGERFDDRYLVDEPLSAGAMGQIYRGRQVGIERDVAIKTIRSDLEQEGQRADRFIREARVISGLSHPNVVNFIDFGRDEDHELLYLVMELVEGIELRQIVNQGPVAVEFALEVATQVCSGLAEPHHHGVVHRDLKPANLLLSALRDGQPQVKIVDFGIAKQLGGGTTLTQTGTMCGTAHYMAPELANDGEVGAFTDLYALGAILYEMLAGETMFTGDTPIQIVVKHVDAPRPSLAETAEADIIPGALIELVDELVRIDSSRRPQTAREVRKRLEAIREEGGYRRIEVDPEAPIEQVFVPWIRGRAEPEPAASERDETIPLSDDQHGSKPSVHVTNTVAEIGDSGASARSSKQREPHRTDGGDLAAETDPVKNLSRLGSHRWLLAGAAMVAGVLGLIFIMSWESNSAQTTRTTPPDEVAETSAGKPPPAAEAEGRSLKKRREAAPGSTDVASDTAAAEPDSGPVVDKREEMNQPEESKGSGGKEADNGDESSPGRPSSEPAKQNDDPEKGVFDPQPVE